MKVYDRIAACEKELTTEELAEKTRSQVVQVIGTKFVLYRPTHKKDKKDKIVLVSDRKRKG